MSPLPSTSTSVAPCLSEIRFYSKVSLEEKKRRNTRKAQYTNTPEYENRQRNEERKRNNHEKKKGSRLKEIYVEIVLDESTEEEGFWEEMKQIGEEDSINVGSFVLVKFLVAKSEIYYVEKIISFHGEEYEVKFFEKEKQSNCFLFPRVDEVQCKFL
ncbi:hypothetical protein FQA39_LY08694 [Lamprigera yunnana]|nr:hypothetical protein FQA39_LY08694 [Lamprigera yunnana]